MPNNFCLDIGGSFIKLGIGTGPSLKEVASTPTPIRHYDSFLQSIVDILRSNGFATDDRLGISITGAIDRAGGHILSSQLPFLGQVQLAIDLARALQQAIGWGHENAVVIENDADCFALAEAHFGAGRAYENIFAIILGTGVGGAQVYRKRLIRGFGDTSGEWGHGPFVQRQNPSAPGFVPQLVCPCGQKGCINTIGGARGLEIIHGVSGDEDMDSRQIIDGWMAGDAACAKTVQSYVAVVSDALALTLNITGAQIVPVGGGLSSAQPLLSALDAAVQTKVLLPRPAPLLIKGATGENGGLWGMHAQLLNPSQSQ